MVIVLIQRCVRKGMEALFLERYVKEKPTNADFLGEDLTLLSAGEEVPEALKGLLSDCVTEGCTCFVNVARWTSLQAFDAAFKPIPGYFDPEIECEPRVRSVLEITNP